MSPRYQQTYPELFSGFGIPLEAEDGCEESEIRSAEARLSMATPLAQRDFFLLAGREPKLTRVHNRLLRPAEWFMDAGRLVFLEENQTVVFRGGACHRW